MKLEDLILYDWNDLSKNPISEDEIKKLLGQDLFRLRHHTIQENCNYPFSSVASVFFVCKGSIAISHRNSDSYTILPNNALQIPIGRYEIRCADNTIYYKAYLTKDIPHEVIKKRM